MKSNKSKPVLNTKGTITSLCDGLFAKTQEQNYEATTQKFFNREYEARGLEVESHLGLGNFVESSLTYTQAWKLLKTH